MSSPDYEEFIDALKAHGVRYPVVGAHAVAFHARPRATKDLDLLVDPSPENAERVLAALREFFGAVTQPATWSPVLPAHFLHRGRREQYG